MGRVRLAFYLRLHAEECGAQIHAPYGYEPLDDLQQFGTLRCSTVTADLRKQLNETEQACSLFLKHYKRPLFAVTSAVPPPVTGTALGMVFAGMNFMISEADAAPYRDPKLQERARADLAFWRTIYKERLEDHLKNVILELLSKMVLIRSQLEDRASELGANAVLGNADQENAGLVLWMAVEAAVAWTAGQPYKSERCYVEASQDAVSGSWMGKVVAATLRGENNVYEHPPELKREHASVVTQLFDVYRIAFLQDDNMLPLWMRTVTDRASGALVTIKTHDKAAALRGVPYSASEILAGAEVERLAQLKRAPADFAALKAALEKEGKDVSADVAKKHADALAKTMTRECDYRASATSFKKSAWEHEPER